MKRDRKMPACAAILAFSLLVGCSAGVPKTQEIESMPVQNDVATDGEVDSAPENMPLPVETPTVHDTELDRALDEAYEASMDPADLDEAMAEGAGNVSEASDEVFFSSLEEAGMLDEAMESGY